MWIFKQETFEVYSTLICEATTPHPKGVTAIRLYNWQDQRLQINIQADNVHFLNDLFTRITHLQAKYPNDISISPQNSVSFDFSANLTVDLKCLIDALNILDDRTPHFAEITKALPLILTPNKFSLISTNNQRRLEFVPTIESQAENTMRAALRATTRASEIALRARYNFPAPMYSWFFNAPSPEPSPAPAQIAEGHINLQQTDEEEEDSEYDDHHAFANLIFGGGLQSPPPPPTWINNHHQHQHANQNLEQLDDFEDCVEYTEQENQLINSLMQQLTNRQNNFIRRGFLSLNSEGRVVLSSYCKNILIQARTNPLVKDANVANFALDVNTAIRALSPKGSHSNNREMYRTGIVGYGMRNIVALMWHCCLEAKKDNSLMPAVTDADAFRALVRGIANGARVGNRDNDFGDDLVEADDTRCDSGKFNSLLTAFLGIFSEVNIIFDYIEYLLQELKQNIINILIDHTGNYALARSYLDLWQGIKGVESEDYLEFVKHVNQQFPNVKEKVLNEISPHDPILKEQIKKDIDQEIRQVEEMNFGFKYIELVSPSVSDLDASWKSRYPNDQSIQEYESSLIQNTNAAEPNITNTKKRSRKALQM